MFSNFLRLSWNVQENMYCETFKTKFIEAKTSNITSPTSPYLNSKQFDEQPNWHPHITTSSFQHVILKIHSAVPFSKNKSPNCCMNCQELPKIAKNCQDLPSTTPWSALSFRNEGKLRNLYETLPLSRNLSVFKNPEVPQLKFQREL